MKKFILLIAITAMMLLQSGCDLLMLSILTADSEPTTETVSKESETAGEPVQGKAEEAPTENSQKPEDTAHIKDFGSCKIEILDASLAEIGGKPVIIVNYNYTNNEKQPKAFLWSVEDSAFQDGIGLDSVMVSFDEEVYDVSLASREIQPEVSYVVTRAYFLNNTSSPVNVEVVKYLNLSDNPKKATKQFIINE